MPATLFHFILFENLFKPRQLYLQPQSCALSNLWLVCTLIFIDY
ncbi:UDP pyrophosphate phosphatase [Streptococcus pneumoniae]|uniref:UDP pyrophosphate phosphatase n=1 Tax=Streptococcus pneumoniae TaxID=1313 RepID=A0A558SIU3_STREE|nr:UDP pyrophosphate phosphatase [Streptococcus pneumoniae]AVD76181.1 UDP pyrophosphate phosphatase [Streptococcus pneumoniae]AVV92410.1 UDP pyrophosphate phosphatase [Streptococcus pneumoniae]AXK92475.1 UDP pyrophosphate phosphatase [Streptococcus pneumoniae]KAA3416786.1 UDP pyrophosphate phosphatase [Streptococcus pneumoniae]